MWIKMTWLLIIQMGFVYFSLSLSYLFSFKHKYIVIMQVFSLFVTKTSLEGVQRAGKGSSETWVCSMHGIQHNLLKSSKTRFPTVHLHLYVTVWTILQCGSQCLAVLQYQYYTIQPFPSQSWTNSKGL